MSPSAGAETVLGIDTATDDVGVAAVRGGELLCERLATGRTDGRPRHASALLSEVAVAVSAAGGWGSISRIAVGTGPGAFTGLRVGIASARALAQGIGKPIVGVGSLAALASGIGDSAMDSEAPRLAVLDARRGEVFAGLYGAAGEELWAPLVASPERLAELLATLDSAPLAVGDGSLRFRHLLEAAGANVLPDGDGAHRIAARHICMLGAQAEARRPEAIEPTYLRRPDAELWRERDRGNTAGG